MATCTDIAGTKPAPATDGISLLPTLLGKGKQQQHEFLFWDFGGYGGQQAVRLGDWKGLRRNLQRGNTKLELYPLAKDASEKNDLAAKHSALVTRIEKIMTEQHRASEVFPSKVLDQP